MRKYVLVLLAVSCLAVPVKAQQPDPFDERDRKCEQAFPGDKEVSQSKHLIYFPAKGMLIACDGMTLEGQRVKLAKVAIARFPLGKQAQEAASPTKIRGSYAYAETGRPVRSVSDLAAITSLELPGSVRINVGPKKVRPAE